MNQSYVKGKALINEKLAEIISFKELLLFFVKYSLHYSKIIAAIVIMVVIFLGTVLQVPYYYAFSITENLTLFLTSAMVYGASFYTFRKSTIFENTRETNLSKTKIYLAIFITMFLFSGLIYLLCIALFLICINANALFLMGDWFFDNEDGTAGMALEQLNIVLLFYWYIAFAFLNFALFYLFQNLSNTKKTFYLFVFAYFTLLIIFGNAAAPPNLSINYDEVFGTYSDDLQPLYDQGLTNKEIGQLFSYFNVPGDIVVKGTIKDKFTGEHYVAAIAMLFIPHAWINYFCAAVWRSTALYYRGIPTKDYGNFNIAIQEDSLKNAQIWRIERQFWWALSMYLWILYFGLFYLIGTFFSRIKKY